MELLQAQARLNGVLESPSPFIEANTIETSFEDIKASHIIPVFIKDNEPLISHTDFVEMAIESAMQIFNPEGILRPKIRLSHPVKGRVPDAKNKPAILLEEHEKTIYYERMMFAIEIPHITEVIDGQELSLTIGGVKSFGLDNLYNKKGSDEHFKMFIGFKNRVCTNLCVWTDGFMGNLKVNSLGQLKGSINTLLESYNASHHLYHLRKLPEFSLTESQFALLVGRSRIYTYLPTERKRDIPALLFGDQQLSTVCKDYYRDASFARQNDGSINLWRLYNLFTGANKSSYIDNFLDRSVNAYQLVEQLRFALEGRAACWYIS